jgi:hypothetical protein
MYNYSFHGVYKPTYTWGASHCRYSQFISWTFSPESSSSFPMSTDRGISESVDRILRKRGQAWPPWDMVYLSFNNTVPSGYVKIAIENGHLLWVFPLIAWWFSIVMLVYQRVYATDAFQQGEVSEGIIHFNTFHSCCRWSKAQCSPPIKAMLMPDLLRWEKSLKDSEGPRFFIAGPQPNRFTKQRLELCLESEILSTWNE